jgi:hypothetical protein
MRRSSFIMSFAGVLALAFLSGTARATDDGVQIGSGSLLPIGAWDGGDMQYMEATYLLPNGLVTRSNWNLLGYNKIDLYWFDGDSPAVYSLAQSLIANPRQTVSGQVQAYASDSTGPHLSVISFTNATFHSVDFPALSPTSRRPKPSLTMRMASPAKSETSRPLPKQAPAYTPSPVLLR